MGKKELTLIEHKRIMLGLLLALDKYCTENNLRYFIAGGTLIGAVRHKGFIPWDDDADVLMPREDYEKLLKIGNTTDEIQVVSVENDHGYYHPFPHANLVDTNTIMFEDQVKKQTNKGVFVDIFPMDGLPDDINKRSWLLKKLMVMQSILSNKIHASVGFSSIRNAAKTVLGCAVFFINEKKYSQKINDVASAYSFEDSNSVTHLVALFGKPDRFINPKSNYSDYIMLEFEGHYLRAPIGYDDVLKRSYGNYMDLPPEDERHGQHGIRIFKRGNLE